MVMTPDLWSGRRVLVTGATGFLGAHLTRRLVDADAQVFAFLRPNSPRLRIGDPLAKMQVIEGDLLDLKSVLSAVEVAKPEFVFHLAAFGVDRPFQDPIQAASVNVLGTVHLLEAVRERPLKRFVYTGTCYEYASENSPIGPEAWLAPANIYAATKSGGALVCQAYQRLYKLPLVIVRPFQSYGPWQGTKLLIPYVIISLLKGEIVKLTSGTQVRDFIFADDVIDGLLLAIQKDCAIGQVINLGNGSGVSVRSVVEQIVALLGKEGNVEFGARPHRPGEVWDLWSDNSAAQSLLGWFPKTPLAEGLQITIDWYLHHIHSIDGLDR